MNQDQFNLALSELIQSCSETMGASEIIDQILVRAAMLSSITSETDSQAISDFQDNAGRAMETVLLSEDFHKILENVRTERNLQIDDNNEIN